MTSGKQPPYVFSTKGPGGRKVKSVGIQDLRITPFRISALWLTNKMSAQTITLKISPTAMCLLLFEQQECMVSPPTLVLSLPPLLV